MGDLKELFKGISVVIDDQVNDSNTEIAQLMAALEQEHCHVVKLGSLPDPAATNNLNGASLFILDWNLHPIDEVQEGVRIPDRLRKEYELKNIEFLKNLKEVQFAPVFIFTHEDIDHVKAVLKENDLIKDDDGDYIFVMGKNAVLDKGLFETLAEWINGHPSAYVLRKWDRAYAKAKNSLFGEFYQNSRFWPIVIWETHLADGVSPSIELGNLISRNIDSRMHPVDFDRKILAEIHKHQIEKIGADEIKSVLAGERFIKNDFLDQSSYSTGDVFKKNAKKYYINIRPECDCVVREGDGADLATLYVIPGSPVTDSQLSDCFNPTYGSIIEPDEASLVFSVYDGKTIRFNFKELKILTVKELNEDGYKRVGRLIPPYVTRLIQRYAAFTQRSGLPRIPEKAIPQKIDTPCIDALEEQMPIESAAQ